jgi:hypothetical protein
MGIGPPRPTFLPRYFPRSAASGPATQIRETGGPVTLTVGAIADQQILRRNGTSAEGISPAGLVNLGFPPILRPRFSGGQILVWDQVISSANGTQGLVGDVIRFQPHWEEKDSATYDALIFRTGTAGLAGSLGKMALYLAGADDKPVALLWQSADIDISSTAQFAALFSTGTTTALGLTYKDGSGRFVLTRGVRVWKAWMRNTTGSPTMQVMGSSTALALAWSSTSLQNAAFTGFSAARAFAGGFPDPAGAVTDENTNTPVLGLRWV